MSTFAIDFTDNGAPLCRIEIQEDSSFSLINESTGEVILEGIGDGSERQEQARDVLVRCANEVHRRYVTGQTWRKQ